MAIFEKISIFVAHLYRYSFICKKNNNDMLTMKQKEYIAPEVKIVEVIVEKGFAISGIVINDRYNNKVEKHIVDDVEEW